MSTAIVTVSQLCRYVKALLEEQKPLSDLLVRGEVTNLSYRTASGHLYFTLGDGDASLRCVMFARYAEKLRNLPEEGGLVVARGTVNLYERDSSFQLLVYDLQELGAGVQQKSLEDTKKRLLAEGIFAAARKRPFPRFPRAVGIVTSPDGAALQDILATFRQRNPLVKLIVYPATVQGTGAAASVTAALTALAAEGLCESCVIARGGGSSEDLSAFNDETLVRAAARCPVPVVSAVGHEIDYSLLDLAADARVATPTAACQLLTSPVTEITGRVRDCRKAMKDIIIRKCTRQKDYVERLKLMLIARSPVGEVKKNRQKLSYLIKSLETKERLVLERLRRRTGSALQELNLVNPAGLLQRGYSITSSSGGIVTSAGQVTVGDTLVTRLAQGSVTSAVLTITAKEDTTHE